MKYLVCDHWGDTLEVFNTEAQREAWLEKYCYWCGANWLVYDLSSFPYAVTSRVLYLDEENEDADTSTMRGNGVSWSDFI